MSYPENEILFSLNGPLNEMSYIKSKYKDKFLPKKNFNVITPSMHKMVKHVKNFAANAARFLTYLFDHFVDIKRYRVNFRIKNNNL